MRRSYREQAPCGLGLRGVRVGASNSDMSDEFEKMPILSDEASDECAPTERDPTTATPRPPMAPSRGAALSVLWWLEGNEAATDWTD